MNALRRSLPLYRKPEGLRLSICARFHQAPGWSSQRANSCYRFVVLDDGGNVRVQGGRYFPQETTARIEGCTLGGSLLKLDWIGLGLFLELSVCGKRIVTSRVRSISINRNSARNPDRLAAAGTLFSR